MLFVFISGEGSPTESTLHIVILWRRDSSHIKYEWLPSGLDASVDQWNDTKSHLESTIQRLLQTNAALSGEAIVKVREFCLLLCGLKIVFTNIFLPFCQQQLFFFN